MRVALLSLISKVAMTAAQFGAAALVLVYFSPIEQGYYYAFIAIIAIQSLFELGLNQVLVVFLAHERGSRSDPGADSQRARTIANASLRDYARLAAAFLLIVGVIGAGFFAWPNQMVGLAASDWAIPWLALVIASTLKLPLMWLEAVLEGLGWLPQVLIVRTLAHLTWLGGLWVGAHAGLGLLSLAIATLMMLIVSYTGHAQRYRDLITLLRSSNDDQMPMDWRKETRVMRRRVSGTWIASYIISSTPIPLTLSILGPAQAGLVGIAFQFAAAIGVITGALIGPRISEAARLVAENAGTAYNRLLRLTMKQTLSAGMFVALTAIIVLEMGPSLRPEYASRVPSNWVTVPLLIAAIINSTLSCVAVFARARKQEMFIRPLFAVAAITAIGTLLAQGAGGTTAISLLHLGAAILVTAPSVFAAFRSLILDGARATAQQDHINR